MSVELLFQQAYRTHQSGNIVEAERLYRAALEAAPEHAEANRYLGVLLIDKGEPAEAESFILRALDVKPEQASFHQNHAMALAQMGDWAASVAACERALVLKPTYARVWFDRGNALMQLGRTEDALLSFQKAVETGLRDAGVFYAMGHANTALGRREAALACYENAVALKPDFLEAVVNRGALLMEMAREQEALVWFDRALVLEPRAAEIHKNRGLALTILRRLPEAREAFRKAIKLAPDMPHLRGTLQIADRYLCDWRTYDSDVAAILEGIDAGRLLTTPFALLSLPSSAAQQKICSQIYSAEQCPPRSQPPMARMASRREGRLRLAYVSRDFSDHPVTYLMAEILERHNRSDFEIFAISYGPDTKCGGRTRVINAVDRFIDVQNMTDRQAAEKIAGLDIDIALDLTGHTWGARPGILSYRPARLQVNYLGYAGTMGASHMDYLIGDGIVTPPDHATYYSEKLVQLPVCYLPPSARPAPRENNRVTRASCGLPENGIVFCAFNNSYKISPDIFSVWMRLLTKLPGSVLWLRDDNASVVKNMNQEAQTRGVDPVRLVFSPQVGAREHFARMALADIFLDTSPYNAHTTAGDALWVGVPVVTLLGGTFPGRVAASLLTDAGLTDLIASSLAEYESLALKLAADSAYRNHITTRLAERRAIMFDTAAFTRYLESAYRQMWARHEAGEEPGGFVVSPSP